MFKAFRLYPSLIDTINGAVVFHGSTSASLLAFTDYNNRRGHLIPTGQLEAEGKVPFSGEIAIGRTGMNIDMLSVVYFWRVQTPLAYSILGNWNPWKGRGKLWKNRLILKVARLSPDDPDSLPKIERLENPIAINKKRLDQWSQLTPLERRLVRAGFPVLYGAKPIRPWTVRIISNGKEGEVGILNGLRKDEIRVIYVPRNRIELVHKILSEAEITHIKVEPIEPLRREADARETWYYD